VAEWLKALVLKTSNPETGSSQEERSDDQQRGESLSLIFAAGKD